MDNDVTMKLDPSDVAVLAECISPSQPIVVQLPCDLAEVIWLCRQKRGTGTMNWLASGMGCQ